MATLRGRMDHAARRCNALARETCASTGAGLRSLPTRAPHGYVCRRGDHQVTGRFTWSRRPESLRVAAATALVDLSIDDKRIVPVDLRNDRLWLGAVRSVTQPRALQVQVYRLLQDGSPMRLVTQLHLKVSGDAREET